MKKYLSILFILFLSGCSSTFVYNNMDWMVHWYIDDYVDLNKDQKQRFDELFVVWQGWHRKEELQKYRAQLIEVKGLVESKSVTPDNLRVQFESARVHWRRMRAQVAPDLVTMSSFLEQSQIDGLLNKVSEDISKDEEELAELRELSDEERVKDRSKDMQKNLKEWIGKLSKNQKALIDGYAPQFISNWGEWIEYQKRTNEAAKQLFAERESNDSFNAELLDLMTNPEQLKHQQLLDNSEHNGKLYSEMVAELFQSLSKKQHKKLIRKIDNYIDDLDDLINDN